MLKRKDVWISINNVGKIKITPLSAEQQNNRFKQRFFSSFWFGALLLITLASVTQFAGNFSQHKRSEESKMLNEERAIAELVKKFGTRAVIDSGDLLGANYGD